MEVLEKNILLTGATSGIGLALVKMIASEFHDKFKLNICIACRNLEKGHSLKNILDHDYKDINVCLVKMDVGLIRSVLAGCNEITKLYTRFDCIILNAGILPVGKINWDYIAKNTLTSNFIHMYSTGEGVFVVNDYTTDEGIRNVFATNILGHFILVNKLLPLISNNESCSQIIWTTSNNATKSVFNKNDLMCENGNMQYGSSKYVLNATSMELNRRFNSQGIYSELADPGIVKTNILTNILPNWIWCIFIVPLMALLRLFISSLTITPQNACHSFLWLLKQNPKELDPKVKYCSRTSIWNSTRVERVDISISEQESREIFDALATLSDKVIVAVKD